MDNQNVIDAFHMMWDNFPEPVMLIQKSRQIYAVNKKAASMGLNTEMKCSNRYKPHRGCLCNKAADEKKPFTSLMRPPWDRPMATGYRLPVMKNICFILAWDIRLNTQNRNSDNPYCSNFAWITPSLLRNSKNRCMDLCADFCCFYGVLWMTCPMI